MTVELALVISGISLVFGIYQGVSNMKRNEKSETRSDVSQLTTVIVKLENIGICIGRIESKMNTMEADFKEDHERLVKIEEATKSAHHRINRCERQCKLLNKLDE